MLLIESTPSGGSIGDHVWLGLNPPIPQALWARLVRRPWYEFNALLEAAQKPRY